MIASSHPAVDRTELELSEPRRVLLADDDPVARMMTTRLLERAGYAVTAVGDGAAALAALRERFHAVLLTDWEMPILDGLGVISGVRGEQWPGYVFTILLTGRDSRDSVLAGLRAGADDYLTKPVDEAELLARITTGWRIADLERSLRAAREDAVRLSITDGLTGLHNRRHLNQILPDEIVRSRRYGTPIAVIICDIDHFKRINDTFGHAGGDAVLQGLARLMATQVRVGIDCVARYGGEEFALVLPQADMTQARHVAERLRIAIENLVVEFGGRPIRLTSSFGVAVAEGPSLESATADELLSSADLGLYRSKEMGRNRVSAVDDAC